MRTSAVSTALAAALLSLSLACKAPRPPVHPQPAAPSAEQQPAAPERSALSLAVEQALAGSPQVPLEVHTVYGARAFEPAWVDGSGEPRESRLGPLRDALDHAPERGLAPGRHTSAELAELIERRTALPRGGGAEPVAAAAHLDVAATTSLFRLLADLHRGQVDPRTLGYSIEVDERHQAVDSLLAQALGSDDLTASIDAAEPSTAHYRVLRRALESYRARAADPTLEPPRGSGKLVPRARHAAVPAMRRFLEATGDLAPEGAASVPPASESYDSSLVEAVKHFQDRHGLTPDGVIGKATWARLAVPFAQRAREIELSLERLRWVSDLGEGPFILVNVPSYRLWVFPSATEVSEPTLTMNVIVGKALETQTPLMVSELRNLVFRPYWNVPRSIREKEIVPALDADPAYLAAHDMELVRDWSGSSPALEPTPENLEALRAGTLRVRQRPGPKNSLGAVKFVFPNDESIYLHGTPSPGLFARSRRDLSHGCVRVEDPVALAGLLLAGDPAWDRKAIVKAMSDGPVNRWVSVPEPLPVLLFYATALPHDGGSIAFYEDVYGLDAPLAAALGY